MKARTLIAIAMCAPICALTLCADPVWRYWAAGDDGAKLNDAKAWNPNGVPGAEDTLGVTIGTNKPARVEAGDDLTVNNLYVGWGRKYDANGTHISDNAANDLGGRLDVSGGILNVLSSLTVGGGWADNNDAVMNVAGGRVNAASLFTGDCGSWSGKKDTINISGSGTVFAVGGGDVRFSNFSGGTTFVNITDGAKFTLTELDGAQREALAALPDDGCIFSDEVTLRRIGKDHAVISETAVTLKAFRDRFEAGEPLDQIEAMSIVQRNRLLIYPAGNNGHLEITGVPAFNALKYFYLFRLTHPSVNGTL